MTMSSAQERRPTLADAGFTVMTALAAENAIARAFGCIGDDGHTWTESYWDRAERLVASDDLALRNAARVLVSSKRPPWERVAIVVRILGRRGAAS